MTPMDITITTRDGRREQFDADRINRSIERACVGLEDAISMVTKIATESHLTLYDGVTEKELDEATISAALQNVQLDTDYDIVAKRLLLKTVYKQVLGNYDSNNSDAPGELHKNKFVDYIKTQVEENVLDRRMINKYDLDTLANTLDVSRDHLFNYAGLSGLINRYTVKGEGQVVVETPQFFFMRVAMGMSYNEENPTEQAIKFYNKMSKLEYIAGGSTNIGAGTTRPALSNCFLLEIQDDIESIAKTVSDVIKISKATGGIGASITKLRASGSSLSSNNTQSSGPTPFAKIIDTAIRAIQRGGKKKGALCFYMENWHLDFPDFIEWKMSNGDDYLRMRTANTAAYMSDEFMKRVQDGGDWYMFDPKETPDLNELYGAAFSRRYCEYVEKAKSGGMKVYKKVPAQEQFRQMLVQLQGTSHPWLTWKDPINLRALNNNTGTIHMSNLCTEICLPQDKDNIAVCNLASLNLSKHINNREIDWQLLEQTTRIMIRHLDNLIDINELPIEEAIKSDRENRAVGLGVMGYADSVEKMGFSYDSQASYNFADKVFEFISYMAIDESANLARERGSYTHFEGSEWSKGKVPFDTIEKLERERGRELTVDKESHHKGLNWDTLRAKVKGGIRNATLMATAPTANIGLVAATTPGIDARFAQVFSRNKISGKYLDINTNLVKDLKNLAIWEDVRGQIVENQGDISSIEQIPQNIRDIYKTSFTTDPYAYIEVAARAQKWVDQALSRNMYLETRDTDEIMKIYQTAWDKGVKTTYYLHMKPRHTAEQSTTKVNKATAIGKVGFGALKAKAPAPVVQVPDPVVEPPSPISVPQQSPVVPQEKVPVAKAPNVVNNYGPEDPQDRLVCDSCQ
ncbi:MAG: ribonucleoside-diphosphate reductase alpha chain [Candidatus Paceibacteria bacterium]|jgi:ribonucleoside-diphosphate reductase alpha chain